MDKCQKCKKKIALIYCSSCISYYCLKCDRLTHDLPKNKNHKRINKTSSFLSLDNNKRDLNKVNNKSKSKEKYKGYNTQNNFHKNKIKEDPDIHLINKLAYNLDNDLDFNKSNLKYKNDFNKIYKFIRITNMKNNTDVNDLLNIIEQQDIIINDLFKKVYYLKQQIKDNFFIDKNIMGKNFYKDENYFKKKIDIISNIYEKEKEKLIKEQENKISKIKREYNTIKNKYLSILNNKDTKLGINDDINKVIKKIKITQNIIDTNTNKLSKINDDLNIADFCMNEHLSELIGE